MAIVSDYKSQLVIRMGCLLHWLLTINATVQQGIDQLELPCKCSLSSLRLNIIQIDVYSVP